MNLFEKIFNYQVISRLEGSGTFMVTSHEKAWLKTMLEHPAAEEAFTVNTLSKLRALFDQEQMMDISNHLIEKARSIEKQVYHPLLRPLRQLLLNKSGIRITYGLKDGQMKLNHSGLPYKLEYSMVKREWYLLWYNLRKRSFMSTKLKKIISVSAIPVEPAEADRILNKVSEILESRKTEVIVEVIREFNRELSRILYAFSCFEKNVEYDAEMNRYQVKVRLLGDEVEYLLSKIRFLGKRVRVVEGDYLKKRMLEASTKALERYGAVTQSENDSVS